MSNLLQDWLREQITNTVVSGHPAAYAHVVAALEKLDPSPTAEAVEAWFGEHMRNSPVSRVTEVYNQVRKAADDLKLRLAPAKQEG